MVKETRRDVARSLGISYSTLRVYERHMGELLPLFQGSNRTTLYSPEAVQILQEAVTLKREGLPFSKLKDYFRGHLARPQGKSPELCALEQLQWQALQLLLLGQRIEEKLRRIEKKLQG